ncbi:unnamed protein product [Schistosoma curassoni]|uniref:Ovule protein n=1 Tax=Schistosoma curassoni TaxID=6186 RepID=A0A183JH97_9TREM|nr:unnamed protein product [Schistosoma curassoni]
MNSLMDKRKYYFESWAIKFVRFETDYFHCCHHRLYNYVIVWEWIHLNHCYDMYVTDGIQVQMIEQVFQLQINVLMDVQV